ncbi:MAG: PHP domain-containing protein [candidate division KSB1 bacterium]|nr:PHP domain-containing protein [candidate division KSB1 bacterium]
MQDKKIDLHVHSKYSDGLLSPAEIVDYAVKRNVSAISITDHDTAAGIESFVRAGNLAGIETVAGIELSVNFNNRELHLLGYCFDSKHPQIKSYSKTLKAAREERAEETVKLLNDLGFPVSMQQVLDISGTSPIGRPHIAEALVRGNFVFNIRDAFNKYLAEGKPAYVPKIVITPADAIQLIKNAGGLTFLAHPGTGSIEESEIRELSELGLDGLETIHPKHTNRDIRYLEELSAKYNLLQTGGSDCHGGREGGIILGTLSIPYSFLNAIKKLQIVGT